MAEQVQAGRPASPGLVIGPLIRLEEAMPDIAEFGVAAMDANAEQAGLSLALERARTEIEALVEDEPGEAADILGFQLALLEDPELVAPAFATIARGSSAAAAWAGALDAQVAEYEAAEDETFRARAADLADLRARVLAALLEPDGAPPVELPDGAILLATDLTPSRFLTLPWARLGGLALLRGSPQAHVAILARARGLPMVTGLGQPPDAIGGPAILDAGDGRLITAPSAETMAACQQRQLDAEAAVREQAASLGEPALTAAGERVLVMVNVDDPAQLNDAVLGAADGIGLFRTEFLFIGRDRLPDEDEQLAAYRSILDRAAGRPVVIRTLDVGGDKPLPGVGLPRESNPFLGLRGLRLCLERPNVFRPQIRALLRATPGRALSVMLPMVAVAAELAEARALFEAELVQLLDAGIEAAMPPLGVMIETPAAALTVDLLPAAFLSIGSNDLTQYVMAASRDADGRVGALLDPLQPAVLRLIGRVVDDAAKLGLPVSLCGDMGADAAGLAALVQLGLRRISVPAAALGRVKRAVAEHGGTHGR